MSACVNCAGGGDGGEEDVDAVEVLVLAAAQLPLPMMYHVVGLIRGGSIPPQQVLGHLLVLGEVNKEHQQLADGRSYDKLISFFRLLPSAFHPTFSMHAVLDWRYGTYKEPFFLLFGG